MTSINAIRFDSHSGAMVCDEQRHWNEERLKLYGADKILPVVSPEMAERYGLAASYGNTGTSAIGDELRLTIRARIQSEYDRRQQTAGGPPEELMDLEQMAELAFGIMTEVKHQHTDDHLIQHFGFTTREFVAGEYRRGQDRFQITDPEMMSKAHQVIAIPPGQIGPNAVFGNHGILAGVSRREGFRVFLFSMKEHYWEPVETGFICHGSGSDTANFVMGRFFGGRTLRERWGRLDRLDALMALIGAVDEAMRGNMGVGGYPVVTLFDARAEDPAGMHREISDHRTRLAAEAIRAQERGHLPREAARELVEGLLFQDRPFQWGEERLWAAAENPRGLHRMLRDYPV